MRSPKNTVSSKFKKISVRKKKIIVDLRIKGLSLNDIADHFWNVYRTRISRREIKQTILDCFKQARKLNGFYDSLVSHLIDVIEIDEIYQGMEGKYLGVVHKETAYLMKLEHLEQKSIENIKESLSSIADIYDEILLVLTDGLPAYKTVISDVFDGIPHLSCHVHVKREINRMQDPYNQAAKRAYKTYKERSKSLQNSKIQCRLKKKKERYLQNHLNSLVIQRSSYYKSIGVASHSTKIYKDPVAFKLYKKINKVQAELRSLRQTISNIEDKISIIEPQITGLRQDYKKKLGLRLKIGKLAFKFKKLLNAPLEEFEALKRSLISVLKRKKHPFAKTLLKFMNNNPQAFSDKYLEKSDRIPPNYCNTNTIESIFSKYRLFFKKYRTLDNSELETAVFEILRFHHNFSKPYTGFRNDTCPLERLNIHSKYDNYLDALFNGESPT